VKAFSTEFERITNEHDQATTKRDFDRLRQIYTEDIVHHDQNVEYAKGIENVILLQKELTSYFPNFENRLVSTFVGRDDGFNVEDTWGWAPYNYKSNVWSSDYPLKNYSWFTLRDGKISYWWLFYGEEVFSVQGKPFDSKMQKDYAAVWSWGDSEAVASLYTPEAIRQDTLYSEKQQGNSAIKAFATHFFAWYPGVHMTLLETFGEFPSVIKRGGIYTVSVSNSSGQPCNVNMLVLLEPDESQQKIAQEWLFYTADSLIACGWAQ
jgi:ketosteroid isomerase-like protein